MSATPIPLNQVESRILLIRGQKVISDYDLAELYGVSTGALNQAVHRNLERFPEDFMFQVSRAEWLALLKSQSVISRFGHGGRRTPPFVFTEQGVAMLSGVLRSPRAIQVNIEIMRAFVRLRQWLASNAQLAKRLEELEKKYDRNFKVVFEAIRQLMAEPQSRDPKREIGFHSIRQQRRGPAASKTVSL